jgi:serine/threonine protein kinase/tetratricopeptide (TPR) repeat protein
MSRGSSAPHDCWEAHEQLVEELERRVAAGDVPDARALSERYQVSVGEVVDLLRVVRALDDIQGEPARDGPLLAPSDVAGVPGDVAGYRVLEELGRGGMGVVYKAWDPYQRREVALKVMLAGRFADARQIERFQAEARAARRFDHPNLAAVLEVGEEDGLHYLVMDVVEGESLAALLEREGPLPERRAAELAERLARALSYAHFRAILHRDLKPSNVLVRSADGEPVLTDFGLAKDVGQPGTGLTRTGQLVGTPAYMPPEQARGSLDRVDRRADVYALGATLYEMLTGQPPFSGASAVEVVDALCEQPPVPPRALRPGLDRALEAVCLRCLEKDPADRYPTAHDLGEELASYLRGDGVQARAPRLRQRALRWVRRNRSRSLVTALLGLTLLLGPPSLWAWSSNARRAARERARTDMIATTRTAARAALVRLEGVRDGAIAGDAKTAAFSAFLACGRWHALAPADPDAARALQRVALDLGRQALARGEWDLAAQAFAEAEHTGVDLAATRAMAARIEEARTAETRRRRDEVLEVLEAAERGQLGLRPDGILDGVFALVRYPDAQTVEILAERLESTAADLLACERDELLHVSGGEAEAPPDLLRALEARVTTRPGLALSDACQRALTVALDRLAAQLRGTHGLAALASRQRQRLGQGRLDAARLAAEALGRLGPSERGADALARYLMAEADAWRAVPAGLALCRLGDPRALALALWGRERFGVRSEFWQQVGPALGDIEVPLLAPTVAGYLRRGEVREALGDLVGAASDFGEAAERDPRDWRGWAARARVALARGDWRGALADLERALALAPSRGRLWLQRARAHEGLGRVEDALADLDSALTLRPDLVEALSERARLRARAGRGPDAHDDLRRAATLEPQSASVEVSLAEVRRTVGDLDGARRHLDRALRRNPRLPAAWLELARLRLVEHDATGAATACSRALELAPQSFSARSLRGAARLQQGDAASAAEDFTQALEHGPAHQPAWHGRGRARLILGDYAGALTDLDRALELTGTQGLTARVLSQRGAARHGLGDFPGARLDLERAVELDPDLPDAHYLLALGYLAEREPLKALEAVEKAMQLEVDDPAAKVRRAELLSSQGELGDALGQLERLLGRD